MENIYSFKARLRHSETTNREKAFKKAWVNYFHKGIDLGETRPVIAASWKRCQNHNVNPNIFQASICKHETLLKKLRDNKELLALIRPFMDDLFEIVKGTETIIAFSDKDGVVLDLCGDSEIAMNAASVNFTVGVNMSEESIGTNSIGTALVSKRPIQVIGAEHFCVAWHTSHCSSAPIKDPFTNEIIGVITLIGYVRSAHSHSLALVKTAAETIVKLIEQQGIKKEKYLLNNYFSAAIDSISDGVIIVNRLGDIIRLNKIASHFLRIPLADELKTKIKDIKHLLPLTKYIEETINGNEVILQDEITLPHEEKFKLLFTSRKIVAEGEHIGHIIILRKKRNKETKKVTAKHSFSSLFGDDPEFKRSIKLAKKAACTDKTVLIIGESGTGKELFAQAIHNDSARQTGPFIAINSAAIPKELIASELFGYVDGAFTNAIKGGKQGKFEAANGGTLFLDEIGDMPLDLQAHLLRVLEEREVTPLGSNQSRPIDVRIVAATNKDLLQLVRENKFRLDLYYRLNVISLSIPPLQKRKQDIELFATHFLPLKKLSTGVLKCFFEYQWPGNLREFKNVMEQIEIFCDEPIVTKEYIPQYIQEQMDNKESESLYQTVANDTKKDTMVVTLKNSKNVSEAAKKLGVSPSTLYRWASECDVNLKELLKK